MNKLVCKFEEKGQAIGSLLQSIDTLPETAYGILTSSAWTQAVAVLRKKIAEFGMKFIGEIIDRPDITENSSPNLISEIEAINLFEYFKIIPSSRVKGLRRTQVIANHINCLEEKSINITITKKEVKESLGVCKKIIRYIPKIKRESFFKFSNFEKKTKIQLLLDTDLPTENLDNEPSFRKATLALLLSSIKTSTEPELQNVLHNTNVILPKIWSSLKSIERWQVGNAYALLYSSGQQEQLFNLREVLLKVGNGFEYIPETTCSNAFTRAAAKLLAVHDGMNSFEMEFNAIEKLASLGTAIPWPAFPVCFSAILASYLGDSFGYSSTAASIAFKMLKAFSPEQWKIYITECLPTDLTILYKLLDEKPAKRWCDLIDKLSMKIKDKDIEEDFIKKLMKFSKTKNIEQINSLMETLLLHKKKHGVVTSVTKKSPSTTRPKQNRKSPTKTHHQGVLAPA